MSDKRFASNVTVDYVTSNIYVDDLRLPFYVGEDIEVETDEAIGRVTITILTDNAHVLHGLDDDLAWIRTIADRHRIELGLPIIEGATP